MSGLRVCNILHQTIKHAPHHCGQVLTRFSDSVYERDHQNRLPIHSALARGMNWSHELVTIIHANHSNLKELDPMTKWPLFALAGMEPSCDLRTIYKLLQNHPELVEMEEDRSCKHIPVKNCKRQKINN